MESTSPFQSPRFLAIPAQKVTNKASQFAFSNVVRLIARKSMIGESSVLVGDGVCPSRNMTSTSRIPAISPKREIGIFREPRSYEPITTALISPIAAISAIVQPRLFRAARIRLPISTLLGNGRVKVLVCKLVVMAAKLVWVEQARPWLSTDSASLLVSLRRIL